MLGHLRFCGAVWLLAVLSLGCERQRPPSPEDAVHAFFVAVDANDCDDAAAWLGGDAKRRFENEDCQSALEALRRKRFDRILGSDVDGRDPDLVLVRVRFSNERAPALIGVRSTRKGHRIVTF